MKTAEEIKAAKEKKRQEQKVWVTKLIDDASEKMFAKTKLSEKIDVESHRFDEFAIAINHEEIQKFLNENGFAITRKDFNCYYLQVK